MKVVYSRRSLADLEKIAAHYTALADPRVARAIASRIHQVIDRIARVPESAQRVMQRPDVRALGPVKIKVAT
jgi:plasmid stabilization system protein ParE